MATQALTWTNSLISFPIITSNIAPKYPQWPSCFPWTTQNTLLPRGLAIPILNFFRCLFKWVTF